MSKVNFIFPHQLFKESEITANKGTSYLIEEDLFFKQYAFHKQKLAYHRASMKAYEAYLNELGHSVTYIDSGERSDIRVLIDHLKSTGVKEFHLIDPMDDWLQQRIESSNITVNYHSSPSLYTNSEDLDAFFNKKNSSFFQTKFYIAQRKRNGVLLNEEGQAEGGKWSFDQDNRKRYPQKKTPPQYILPNPDQYWQEAVNYVNEHFADNPGELDECYYPYNFSQTEQWLNRFVEIGLAEFGPYEDAIVYKERALNHSVLSPMLNNGLLKPDDVITAVLKAKKKRDLPLQSVEAIVRQIIGWREFIYGMYKYHGRKERTRNFWGFDRKIPASFYDGTTGIGPIDISIKKILKSAYAHHIERLMVLGNFMLLCEFDPDEVYQWFMELFIDAYDWVMVPNVYGMSQFADAGLFATKPYLSGSNYLKKMSDYPSGDWEQVWDGLYWRFIHVNREVFANNNRMRMMVSIWDRMGDEKKETHLRNAEEYLSKLDGK
ncbi:cryptochrome/photolyase family protein [bacterium]|nr:cryptochrome/photolyase family protein [bacterium]